VTPEEQPIEEGRLALREIEIPQGIVERTWLRRHTEKGQFTDFRGAVKSACGEKESYSRDLVARRNSRRTVTLGP
jgi:hypothetical protein